MGKGYNDNILGKVKEECRKSKALNKKKDFVSKEKKVFQDIKKMKY